MHTLAVSCVGIPLGHNEENVKHHALYLFIPEEVFLGIGTDDILANFILHFLVLEKGLPWTLLFSVSQLLPLALPHPFRFHSHLRPAREGCWTKGSLKCLHTD